MVIKQVANLSAKRKGTCIRLGKPHRCPLSTRSAQICDIVQLCTCAQLECVFDQAQSGDIASAAGLKNARDFVKRNEIEQFDIRLPGLD